MEIQTCSSSVVKTENPFITRLHRLEEEHPMWSCQLMEAFSRGFLTLEDCRYIFSQYFMYSKNFTRYLAALMATCDKDYYRSRLSENLWEEGGGAVPEQRHAEIFRNFLKDGLGLDINNLQYDDHAKLFSKSYLDYCLQAHPAAASAFLSMGTEGIVARLYAVICQGLLKAGIAEKDLHFFHLHMECDDEHALTLKEMMLSYQDEPGFMQMAEEGLMRALDLRTQFFDGLYETIRNRRIQTLFDRIQNKTSLAAADETLKAQLGDGTEDTLYDNTNDRLGIDFNVTRLPFKCEVLDPRILRIAPRKSNENHCHPHETLMYVIEGQGRVCIDEKTISVSAGDVVFIPRWCRHQSHNETEQTMTVLAIADYGLTSTAFIGNQLKTTRLKHGEQAV